MDLPPSLSEVLADAGHGQAATGFGLALALQAASQAGAMLWVRQDLIAFENGDFYGPGLIDFGGDPDRLIIATLRTATDVLRAALEGARCHAIRVVVIELQTPIDLTASRRLKLAAEKSGVRVILVRHAPTALPNAAQMRWRVRAMHSGERCRGRAIFEVTRLKHPAGLPEQQYVWEWDCDRHTFSEAVSQSMVAVPASRSLAA